MAGSGTMRSRLRLAPSAEAETVAARGDGRDAHGRVAEEGEGRVAAMAGERLAHREPGIV